MKMKFLPIVLAVTLMMGGCSAKATENTNENVDTNEMAIENNVENEKGELGDIGTDNSNGNEGQANDESSPGDITETSNPEVTAYKLLSAEEIETIRPNEMGEVMVIMYHGIVSKNSTYTRTAESFRADLEELYAMGFRALSLRDFVSGNITTKAGYTPVVFTFDDGNQSNFNIILGESGELNIDPDSAVGILEAFYKKHPDFGLEATFFLNGGTAFGQKDYLDYKLNYIVDAGMDIGNHSYGHEHFSKLDAKEIEKSLGKNKIGYKDFVENYEFDLLALPFGERPKEDDAREKLKSGNYEGVDYENIAILNVGWRPSYSPYSGSFDKYSILRVQSGDGKQQMRDYLDTYYNSPGLRFISDGNPNTITIPERRAEKLNQSLLEKFEIITYNDKE
ncbi:MAG: polysaccharide deacetylase family protein [Acidaminobacteraceae bacterium]